VTWPQPLAVSDRDIEKENGYTYYWVTAQSEYSTDIMFKRGALAELYPRRIFVKAGGSDVNHIYQTSTGAWTGWASMGGLIAAGQGVWCSAAADGSLGIRVFGPDNLWHYKWQVTPGGSWTGWSSPSGFGAATTSVRASRSRRSRSSAAILWE
jgi:hypothetical protein